MHPLCIHAWLTFISVFLRCISHVWAAILYVSLVIEEVMHSHANVSSHVIKHSKLGTVFQILWAIESMWNIVVPSVSAFVSIAMYRYSKSRLYTASSTIACITVWIFCRYYILGQVPVFLTPQFKECASTVRLILHNIRTQIVGKHKYTYPLIVNLGILRSCHLQNSFQKLDLNLLQAEAVYLMHRYMNFSAGSYGVLFYPHHLTSHSITNIVKHPTSIISTLSSESVICEVTGISKSDIILTQLKGENLLKPAYYICVDRSNKALVLAIRGTLTLSDAITDITAVSKEFLCGEAHHGISAGAIAIFNEVKGILENKLQSTGFDKLVITGHSLGGGTAVLLTLHLLSVKGSQSSSLKNCDIRCYSYAPPPVFYCKDELPPSWQEAIVTVVNGNDIIPRVSLANMYKLLLQMQNIDSLQFNTWDRCKLILNGKAEQLSAILDEISKIEPYSSNVFTPLRHVGKVVWLGTEKKDNEVTPVLYSVSENVHPQLNNIYLGNNFIADHWPHDYQKTLKSYLDVVKKDF